MGLVVAPGRVTWWEQADRAGCGCVVTKKCTPAPTASHRLSLLVA